MEGMYSFPRNIPADLHLTSIFERPGESNSSLNTVESDYPDLSSLEFGQCIIRGHLYKRERFMSWTKLYCIIRNNFLECHKSHGGGYTPALKLFLPGSEVKHGGGDAKRKHAFQVGSETHHMCLNITDVANATCNLFLNKHTCSF